MKGRKPKPPGMSTRNRDGMDNPRGAKLPACPAHLQGEARKEWKRLGKKLVTWRLMTEIDAGALALYCTAWARWVEAEEALAKYGTVIKSPSGYPVQSPYLAIANKAMDQMTRLLVEFGMSPSARSRVTPAPAEEQRPAPARTEEERDPREYLRALK